MTAIKLQWTLWWHSNLSRSIFWY